MHERMLLLTLPGSSSESLMVATAQFARQIQDMNPKSTAMHMPLPVDIYEPVDHVVQKQNLQQKIVCVLQEILTHLDALQTSPPAIPTASMFQQTAMVAALTVSVIAVSSLHLCAPTWFIGDPKDFSFIIQGTIHFVTLSSPVLFKLSKSSLYNLACWEGSSLALPYGNIIFQSSVLFSGFLSKSLQRTWQHYLCYFLGFSNYYHPHINFFSQVVSSLVVLTFAVQAFCHLKACFSLSLHLHYLDLNSFFLLRG